MEYQIHFKLQYVLEVNFTVSGEQNWANFLSELKILHLSQIFILVDDHVPRTFVINHIQLRIWLASLSLHVVKG